MNFYKFEGQRDDFNIRIRRELQPIFFMFFLVFNLLSSFFVIDWQHVVLIFRMEMECYFQSLVCEQVI